MKLTKAQVQKQIQSETINGETIHYSYANKYQATLSMFKNQRLLIFNFNSGMLYYVNQPKQLPFKTAIPKPKNQTANMNVSIAKNPPNTSEFHVQFVMKNQKNQNINVEWNFLLDNKTLAQDWVRVIQSFKNKKIQEMMKAQEKKKQQANNKNPTPTPVQNQKVNNAWIHDTLGFGLMPSNKKPQVKPQPKPEPKPQIKTQPQLTTQPTKQLQPKKQTTLTQSDVRNIKNPQQSNVKPQINQTLPGKMAQSKFQKSPQKSPQKPPAQQSPIKKPESNLNVSQTKNVTVGESKVINTQQGQKNVQPQNKNISQSNVNPTIRQSTVTPTIQQSAVTPNTNQLTVTPAKPINQSQVKPTEQSGIKKPIVNPNQQSPSIRKSQIGEQTDPRMSKLTLRDQLESILQRSHLRQSHFENSYITQQEQSRISKNTYKPQNDWNLKFLRKQNEQVLLDFQDYAKKAFLSILKEDQTSLETIRVYFKPQCIICVADARTNDAKKLKTEFRNYHFIMQSCKDNFIVGVPLSCLIEHQGLVCLVQSLIPEEAPKIQLTQQVMHELKDLQRYTRIKNTVLKRAALYDLTDLYESKDRTLIYINQLLEYLPVHPDENYRGGLLRPEHILDNVNQFMHGGMSQEANRKDLKALHDTLTLLEENVKALAKQLSTQDITFASGHELKVIMHQRGINLKYLPLLYAEVTNKSVKKYIHTFMTAKVSKDYILEKLAAARYSSSKTTPQQTVQSTFKLLLEGNNNNSNQLWKQILLRFKKQYNFSMSNHDLSGPFFLNSIIKLIPGIYDLTKLNDKKAFFRDDGIINKGFVAQVIPKIKSYYRYTTQLTDKIIWTCKQEKSQENFRIIVDEFKLSSQQIPRKFQLSKVNEQMKEYLSFFACPSEFQPKSFSHLKLFETVGKEPPSTLSLAITRNYLQWCLQKEQLDRFKQLIEQTLSMIDYWFDSSHIFHCEFLELLADYFQLTGAIDESIKIIKESLSLCLKNGASISKKTGQKYFNLAEKQLRAGRKKDSLDSFTKAKNIMENFNDQSEKYPITLMKLSSLYLNNNDFQNCVVFSKRAVEKFQELQNNKQIGLQKGFYDLYCIKAIQIMTRAFEIENKKGQLYRVGQLCATKYNRTSQAQVFEQVIKICLTAVIVKHNQQKCGVFQTLIQRISANNQNQQLSPKRCLEELMAMAEYTNVMEKFMFKFQSLERIFADVNSKRALSNQTKQFISIIRYMVGVVGEDYLIGLIRQKDFQ